MLVRVNKTVQAERFPERVSQAVETVKDMARLLGLDDTWRCTLSFKSCGDSLATCMTEWEYRKAVISVNLLKTEEDPHGLRKALIHEMLHIPMWQVFELIAAVSELAAEDGLEDQMRKAEESLVTFLEHAPMWDIVLPEKAND